MCLLLSISIITLAIASTTTSEILSVTSCEGSSLPLSCDGGLVLNIIRANYGRLSNNICLNNKNNKNNHNWSVRCINPTTLRDVVTICGGKTSCSVSVSSNQFGDPCPGTNKYLEIVYSCQDREETHSTTDIPAWLKYLKITTTTTARSSSTTTTATNEWAKETTKSEKETTTTTNNKSARMVSFNIFEELNADSELLIQDFQEDSDLLEEKKVFVNSPVEKVDTIADAMNDKTILAAVVISSVSCFLIIFIGIVIFINRENSSKTDLHTVYSDSTSTTHLQAQLSEGVRLPSNFVIDEDNRIYQTIDNYHILQNIDNYHTLQLSTGKQNWDRKNRNTLSYQFV